MNRVVTFYPASGCRYSTSGAFIYTGGEGDCWSSAFTGASGCRLAFNPTAVSPLGSAGRAYGFPVRCVQNLLLFEKLNLLYG
jgi:hypothetical protein